MEEKPIYRVIKPYDGRWGVKWNRNLDYNFMPKQITRDNQKTYNTKSGGGDYRTSIRIPSLKRSNKIWRNFYNLFPDIKGKKTFRGYKLKQIN
jgi:hypothetical protein